MNLELLKKIALGIVPARFQLPVRFRYEQLIGRLEPEMFLLDRLIGSKRLVVDVGANYGLFSYFLAKMGKYVEAFEPLPGCARHISAYRSSRIRVHNVALSSAPGTLRLFTPIIDGVPFPANSSFTPVAGPHESCDVPVRTLDEYSFEDICLVKIDVEGHELEVLKGAAQTLRRERPAILVEIGFVTNPREERRLKDPKYRDEIARAMPEASPPPPNATTTASSSGTSSAISAPGVPVPRATFGPSNGWMKVRPSSFTSRSTMAKPSGPFSAIWMSAPNPRAMARRSGLALLSTAIFAGAPTALAAKAGAIA